MFPAIPTTIGSGSTTPITQKLSTTLAAQSPIRVTTEPITTIVTDQVSTATLSSATRQHNSASPQTLGVEQTTDEGLNEAVNHGMTLSSIHIAAAGAGGGGFVLIIIVVVLAVLVHRNRSKR